MSITTNEVTKRLKAFAANPTFTGMSREEADEKLFTAEFLNCFGIALHQYNREHRINHLDGTTGYADAFIPTLILIEAKTKGKNLNKAREQAETYRFSIATKEQPQYILLHDFERFELFDLVDDEHHEVTLSDLHKSAKLFSFLYQERIQIATEENPINREAAYLISRLHAGLLEIGYSGHDLEVFLTRLLFCFFADDTLIFQENGLIDRWLRQSKEDGDDLGSRLTRLFDVLNAPTAKRQKTLNDDLAQLDYVNGGLFQETIRISDFDSDLRHLLLKCSELNWSEISPAIFGSMFQGVLDKQSPDDARKQSRRELGAHYTSEKNILKVIDSLFMDDLRQQLKSARTHKAKLFDLHEHIAQLNFIDPACGCGNFLVIAYRELRRLEHDLIDRLYGNELRQQTGMAQTYIKVNIGQFYGIEIEEHACEIAKVALYITDHQMNLEAATRFGQARPTIPLEFTPHIIQANALRYDWAELLLPAECAYIMGNPPFIGKQYQTDDQKEDMKLVCGHLKGYGVLDYVCAWYIKAANYMGNNKEIAAAFVSTNSISQGEQVPVMWQPLIDVGLHIRFAHRTFQWSNEGKGVAAVHCVIIGFSFAKTNTASLFDYPNIKSDPNHLKVKNISPYLIDSESIIITSSRQQLSNESSIAFGSMANDSGFLLMSAEERNKLLTKEPLAAKYIRSFLDGRGFINNLNRWCLWFADAMPSQINTDLQSMPLIREKLENVKRLRSKSNRLATRELAITPHLFGEIRQPKKGRYLLIPRTSSENRNFIPIGFIDNNVINSDANFSLPDATLYHFGVLSSTMHNAWMRIVAGRLKSDYRYSNTIVYNNYPFPFQSEERQRENVQSAICKAVAKIEQVAQQVLDVREHYIQQAEARGEAQPSLADLYRVGLIDAYPELTKTHKALDKAVDAAYGYKGKPDDASRVAFLFERYEQLMAAR